MSAIFSYILLGLSLSAPIGPVNAAQLDTGIRKGFLHSWLVGLGALTADIIYMLMVYMGLVHFIQVPFLQAFVWLFGCFVLLYTGIESLTQAGTITERVLSPSDPSLLRSFGSGFFISLTNPLTILFWLGIYGSVLAETATKHGPQQLMLYSLAIIAGIVAWDFTMASVSSYFRKVLTNRLLQLISIVSGLSLIGFGAYFGLQAAKLLFG